MRYFIFFFLFTVQVVTAQPVRFSTAGFYQLANTGREVYSMNQAWKFIKSDVVGDPHAWAFDDSAWEVVSVPHGLEYLPLDASGGINYQGVSWYRKRFTPENKLQGKRLFLHFEAIMGKSKIWVNGMFAGEHYGGYLPVIIDVTDLLEFGKENVIAVKTDNSDDPDYPIGKPQNLLDFTYFGGIYRDCWLVAHNDVYITDPNYENEVAGGGLFVSYDKVSEQSALVNLKAHIRNAGSRNRDVSVLFELRLPDETVVQSTSKKLSVRKGRAAHVVDRMKVSQPRLWSPDSPHLYYLDVTVRDEKGNRLDGYRQRIGIRSIEFKALSGLWINGKPYQGKIMGTNRHQDFAVLGNALPNSIQWRDAKKLRDAGMKVIRTHYVIDPAFMDACDELGLFALVEVPGWQFWSNKPIFGERVCDDIRNMIRIHRNHASLFFWEPILNETHYPKEFAEKARKICDEEYPYPYSTASCDDGAAGDEYYSLLLRPRLNMLKPDKTYFVREWGDNVDDWNAQNSNSRVARNWGESPMLIQAQHYEKGYQTILSHPTQIVGGCFWHSFDHQRGYHTDPFYGGMMDAFRQPKYSYYMFMSHREPANSDLIAETGPMIYIAHEMTPFSSDDVTVFSNCEEVRLTLFEGGKQITMKKQDVSGVASPVFVFPNVFDFMETKRLARAGKQKEYYLLAEGLIDGKVVVSHKRFPSGQADHIRLRLDNDGVPLMADGSDVVTVIAEIVDKRGTVKRLNNSSIQFQIEGEGRIVGDESIGANPRQVNWGSAPVLIQSTTSAGKIKITASILHAGDRRPTDGVLEFESIPNDKVELFSIKDLDLLNTRQRTRQISSVVTATSCDELKQENILLRKELNDLKVKEVERQQTEFGVGIND